MARVTHKFKNDSVYANLCNTPPRSERDWERREWCRTWRKKVTCTKCLKLLSLLSSKGRTAPR